MSNTNPSPRLLAILADTDHAAFLASATAARYAAEGVQINVISPNAEYADADQTICELVAHIRRHRPDVVVTSGPWDSSDDVHRMVIGQQATAAVMRAPDPRYGHTCCARGTHAVSKLFYTATDGPITTRIDGDTYYLAFSTVTVTPGTEMDLFDSLRRSTTLVTVAA